MFNVINSWGCCKYMVIMTSVAVTGLKLQKWSKTSKKLNSKNGMETVGHYWVWWSGEIIVIIIICIYFGSFWNCSVFKTAGCTDTVLKSELKLFDKQIMIKNVFTFYKQPLKRQWFASSTNFFYDKWISLIKFCLSTTWSKKLLWINWVCFRF